MISRTQPRGGQPPPSRHTTASMLRCCCAALVVLWLVGDPSRLAADAARMQPPAALPASASAQRAPRHASGTNQQHRPQQQQQQQQRQEGSYEQAKAAFLKQFGSTYGYKGWLEASWQQEVGLRLGPHLQHYLDFTGAALYTRSAIRAANEMLESRTLTNPHSRNPSSVASEEAMAAARKQVLAFFSAPEDEYTVVWTSGTTASLKLVGEAFPWSSPPGWQPEQHTPPGGFSDTQVGHVSPCGPIKAEAAADAPFSRFVFLRSLHKSVQGIGAYARARGALLSCVDEDGMNAWLADSSSSDGSSGDGSGSSRSSGDSSSSSSSQPTTFSLVAYPSKCNYEGKLHPLAWIEQVHAKSMPGHRWLVVVDAAAHVPTHHLNLTRYKPDFVPCSFYKIFGFPTGLGALVARKESLTLLHKTYFGGGSVQDSTAEDAWRVLMPPPEGYEDGTQHFLGIAQLQYGFEALQALGGIQAVEAHVRSLQSWLYPALTALRHGNGAPLVRLFGEHAAQDFSRQSCIFQMLVLTPEGQAVSSEEVEVAAGAAGLGLRTGCMCNPSQCIHDLGIRPEEHRAMVLNNTDVSSGFLTVWRRDPATGARVQLRLPVGSVRVSLGFLSTFDDVYAFVAFLRETYLVAGPEAGGGGGGQTVGVGAAAAVAVARRQ